MDGKKLAEMAAKQEAIRKALKEAHDKVKGEGGKMLGDMGQAMEDMKQTEEELKRQELTAETLMRQQNILNRLLDAQKSVREKEEYENRRESNSAKEKETHSPDQLAAEDYKNRLRQELLKTNQLEYSSDFIILIEKYFKLLEQTNE
jgi:Rad3-related DNA helicase